MAEGSKLLINEPPLQVLPTLARLVGIEKAIILQQVQYWIVTSPHERDGHHWIYNSYRQWAEQFPWLSARAVRHHITGLEADGLLVSGEYNKDERDNTKWYRIGYQSLNALLDVVEGGVTDSAGGMSTSDTPPVNIRPSQVARSVTPLPETTSETTIIDNGNDDRPVELGMFEHTLGVMLTPLVADEIAAMLPSLPEGWFAQALNTAADRNARNWAFVRKVLENWKAAGYITEAPGSKARGAVADGVDHIVDPDKYVKGKYGHMVSR